MMNRSALLFLSASALVLLLFLTVFPQLNQRQEVNLPSLVPRRLPTPTISPWLTYSNSRFRYSISYPRQWEKTEWDFQEATKLKRPPYVGTIWQQTKFEGPEGNFQIVIWANHQKTPFLQWVRWYRAVDVDQKKVPVSSNYQILGKEAYFLFQEKTSWGYPVVRIFFPHEDHVFEFIAQDSSENLDSIYQGMISSFKLES